MNTIEPIEKDQYVAIAYSLLDDYGIGGDEVISYEYEGELFYQIKIEVDIEVAANLNFELADRFVAAGLVPFKGKTVVVSFLPI